MGLDLLMFVMHVEDAFEIRIPGEDFHELQSPRRLSDYLARKFGAVEANHPSLAEIAFEKIRDFFVLRVRVPRPVVRLHASFYNLLPRTEREVLWEELHQVFRTVEWPVFWSNKLLGFVFADKLHRIHGLIDYLIVKDPESIKGLDMPWTRAQIAEVVDLCILDNLNIEFEELQLHRDMTWGELGVD